jgi:hypothetical protein
MKAHYSGHPAVQDIGRLVRWLFFLATGMAIVVGVYSLDWSVLDTPFDQLTLHAVGDHMWRILAVLAVGYIWISWAFADAARRHYRAWAYLGAVALVCGFAALVLHGLGLF